LRAQLANRDQQITALTAQLDNLLDREQAYALTPERERLTPAAELERCATSRLPRTHRDPDRSFELAATAASPSHDWSGPAW
jgi:hypothetical protein